MTTENPSVQAAFVAAAKARLDDPMVTEEPRTESSLDTVDRMPYAIEEIPADVEFDDAPGTFENDVLSRLEDLDVAIASVRELNEKTHAAMDSIVSAIEGIKDQVEPTIKLVMESKIFRMFVPQQKGK